MTKSGLANAYWKMPSMLVVGGNARNIGKTTLACNIIHTFSKKHKLVGLKVITHRKGEAEEHGEKDSMLEHGFRITEEWRRDIHKDTARMLQAGAANVYMIRTFEKYLKDALQTFFNEYGRKHYFVCESGAINDYIRPGVFIYVRDKTVLNPKSSSLRKASRADLLLETNGQPQEINSFRIELGIKSGAWLLLNE